MVLSAPVYHLKRKARALSRLDKIPLHAALDRVAGQEGYAAWSLLVERAAAAAPAAKIFPRLARGDMLLLGARPGHGKTLLALELAVEAMKSGSPASVFSLEDTRTDVHRRLRGLGVDPERYAGLFGFDGADTIDADHIAASLSGASPGTVVVVDYLQALDHRRESADLTTQVTALRALARRQALIVVLIAQVDRRYDPALKPVPDLRDVRLPNRLDLGLFDKTCFLNDGAVRFRSATTVDGPGRAPGGQRRS